MALTEDIAAMYRRPRAVVRAKLALPPREDRLLLYLLLGCLLLFVAQAPAQARVAALTPDVPVEARLYWSAFFCVFLLPFALYALAAFSHLLARLVGGQGGWHRARLALFWSVLAAAPLALLTGLVAAFVGPGPAQSLMVVAAALAFLGFWFISLNEAERPH